MLETVQNFVVVRVSGAHINQRDFFHQSQKRGLGFHVRVNCIMEVRIHKQDIITFKEENFKVVYEFLVILAVMHSTLH